MQRNRYKIGPSQNSLLGSIETVHNSQESLIDRNKYNDINGDIVRKHRKGTSNQFDHIITLECAGNSNYGYYYPYVGF